MTRKSVEAYFQALAEAYCNADFERVAEFHAVPSAIYVDNDVLVFSQRYQLLEAIKENCAANYKLGCRSVKNRVLAQSFSCKNNYWVWVNWQNLDGEGNTLFETHARYFCSDEQDRPPLIRLVEFTETPQAYPLMAEFFEPLRHEQSA